MISKNDGGNTLSKWHNAKAISPSNLFKRSTRPTFEHNSLKNEHSWIIGLSACLGNNLLIAEGRIFQEEYDYHN